MTQGGTTKLPTARRYKDRGSLIRRDMKNSSIPRSNKSRPKPVSEHRKVSARKVPENTTQDTSNQITQGIFITQQEEMVFETDLERDGQTNNQTNETCNEQICEDSRGENLDTSSPDRTVTKCSTDSGIGDIEQSKIGPRNKSTINAGMRKDYFKGLDNLRKMISGKSLCFFLDQSSGGYSISRTGVGWRKAIIYDNGYLPKTAWTMKEFVPRGRQVCPSPPPPQPPCIRQCDYPIEP